MEATRTAEALPPEAKVALQNGNKIEAIKIVRESRGLGLKEAKDAVEAHVARDPALRASLESAQAASRQGALRWLSVVVAIVVIAGYFLLRK